MKKSNPVCYSSLVRNNKIKPFCTFDTETEGLGGNLICITSYNPVEGKPRLWLADQLQDFLAYCEEVGGDFYAHNLTYDLRAMMPKIIKTYGTDLNIMLRANKDIFLLEVKYDNESLFCFRDSYALFPHPLKDFSEKFAPNYTKFTINDIEHFDITNVDHVEYALQDSVSLYHSLLKFKELISESFGCDVTATISSTAVKAWRCTIPKGHKFFMSNHKASLELIRYAYYGGLTGLTSTEVFYNTKTYDINSSYPAVMESIGVPYGGNTYTNFLKEKDIDRIGFVKVKVKTPDDLVIPILPTRDDNGNMIWRKGEFVTVVTTPELLFALKHGYEVTEYISGVFFAELVKPFSDFVSSCRTIRYENKGQPLEQVAKLMQNSLYGKFGLKDEGTEVVVVDPDNFDLESVTDYFSTTIEGLFFRTAPRKALTMPQWSSWITAMARLRLLKVMYEIGVENVIYYDTDSITIKENIDFPAHYIDGLEYGKFKLEKTSKQFRAIAPKVYTLVLDDDSVTVKAKGIPTRNISEEVYDELYKAIMENNIDYTVSFDTLSSLPVYLKTGKNLYSTTRKITNISNSTNWNVDNKKVSPKHEIRD